MKRLGILTAIHARHELAIAVLRNVWVLASRLQHAAEIRIFAVLSPEDQAGVAGALEEYSVGSVLAPNLPVSEKWTAGLAGLRDEWPDLDAVLRIDSDDFPNERYLRQAIRYIGQVDGLGPDRVHILDGETGRLGIWSGPWYVAGPQEIPAGAGRLFSRRLLEAVSWDLWPGSRDSGLNSLCSRHLAENGLALDVLDLSRTAGAAIVDVKTPKNIHPWKQFHFKETWEPAEAARILEDLDLSAALEVCTHVAA